MSYSNKLAACIVSSGKILRESGSEIRLPFGSEYAVRVKNLNSTRVAVSVFIDDVDVLQGSRIVIDPNESHDIEGFMSGNTIRNRFRFIEKTSQISQHRGDRVGDGLIRIEYQFEKPKPVVLPRPIVRPPIRPYPYQPWYGDRNDIYWLKGGDKTYGCLGGACGASADDSLCDSDDTMSPSPPDVKSILRGDKNFNLKKKGIVTQSMSSQVNEDGITVKGSHTHRDYNTTWLNEMEEAKYSIVFALKGEVEVGGTVKKKSRKQSVRAKK